MDTLNYVMFSSRPTPLLEQLEGVAFLFASRGEPIPLDVAADLMAEGINMEAFEKHLERLPMSFRLKREENESWRDCAIRQASKYGMADEVAQSFDSLLEFEDEENAAFDACYEWDVLDWSP